MPLKQKDENFKSKKSRALKKKVWKKQEMKGKLLFLSECQGWLWKEWQNYKMSSTSN